LLHLHPLTLEDILQQEPREKLELFPRLGYYFISFRAVETRQARRRRLGTDATESPGLTDGGVVSEVPVYLIVFREGIISVGIRFLPQLSVLY
jgi:magnesium transporter